MTKIEWCDEVYNPVTGCTPISEGCQNCYAKRMANRLKGRYGYPVDDPFRVTFHPERLDQPLKWKKPRRIFVGSMGDLFHQKIDVDSSIYSSIFQIIRKCPQHTFMILTKRPGKMKWVFKHSFTELPNLWLGVTAENQEQADERIPILLQIPAAVRFVSVEPLLSNIDLTKYLNRDKPQETINMEAPSLNWVICGAETGPGARVTDDFWIRLLRDQCQEAGVQFFMKKVSGKRPIPDDLNVREFPVRYVGAEPKGGE